MSATVSLCVITGNEAHTVEVFLDSFKDAFDELCIVRAVGNKAHDNTLQLARDWCKKNKKFIVTGEYFNAGSDELTREKTLPIADDNPATWPHVDDFSAARQQSWELATSDWQFWADLDDLLEPALPDKPGGAELIRLCAGADSHDYFFFTYDIRLQNERNVRERLFRTGISTWRDPIHETVKVVEPAEGKQWKALIEPRVIFEHAPTTQKPRDMLRNRRIMGWHTRYIDRFAFEIHREWFYDWAVSGREDHKEKATKWAEIAHQTDCLPEQRYDMLLNQAQIVAAADVEHAIDLCWSAIRIHPKSRDAWARLAEYELKQNRGNRAAVLTGFMQSIPKAQECGYPQSNRYFGWEGAQLRTRSLRAAGQDELATKTEDAIFEKAGRRISLLHATRGRPDLAILTRATFYRAAYIPIGIEHIFAIDADDTASLEALKDYRHVVVEQPNGCVKAWNAAAATSTGHVLVQLSDDWNPCQDWDVRIWEAFEGVTKKKGKEVGEVPLVLAVNDGHRNDTLLCMAILTRARYEQQCDAVHFAPDPGFTGGDVVNGKPYLFHPDYFGVFSDTEFTARAYDDGIVVQAQAIEFEHKHPLFAGKPYAEWDETHKRQNAPERYAEGKAIFNRRNPTHAFP